MDTWFKIVVAAAMLFMIWRLLPFAKDQLENGRKGSSGEWLNFSLVLGGVVLFVLLLMALV